MCVVRCYARRVLCVMLCAFYLVLVPGKCYVCSYCRCYASRVLGVVLCMCVLRVVYYVRYYASRVLCVLLCARYVLCVQLSVMLVVSRRALCYVHA